MKRELPCESGRGQNGQMQDGDQERDEEWERQVWAEGPALESGLWGLELGFAPDFCVTFSASVSCLAKLRLQREIVGLPWWRRG